MREVRATKRLDRIAYVKVAAPSIGGYAVKAGDPLGAGVHEAHGRRRSGARPATAAKNEFCMASARHACKLLA